ncbi:hypothetical protein RHS01_07015 [Rhizoctonia solani]|uniref:VASt domain-containing protein n=1 Tax=Rhizoctonia solani TaxID=456999 RepID=A0A8H7IDP5_9AGAM|nr:hypothetical protein RHS01_07015 [Rhizoctonia solani]
MRVGSEIARWRAPPQRIQGPIRRLDIKFLHKCYVTDVTPAVGLGMINTASWLPGHLATLDLFRFTNSASATNSGVYPNANYLTSIVTVLGSRLPSHNWLGPSGSKLFQLSPPNANDAILRRYPEGLQLNHNVTRIQVTDTITHLRDCPFSSSVLSTIYAPDVASGHAFAVKTRTCIIPHAKSEARLFVTAVLVWGDGSDFQRPIGQAALVGLRQYHDNILSVMREEISTNKEVYASLDEAAIIEYRLPTNPDGVLDAMYTDREPVMSFWQRDQGFTDLHSTGWFPQDPAYPNSRLRTRSTSFTKDIPDGLPLSHGVVGKRTRIEVIDTITHSEDGPTGTAILSTLRAPNLMNGHAFAVRTRTCLVPEGTSGTRLLVTAMVRWNQRVNYGETIEDFAFDALKKYYQDITNFTRREMISYKGGYESFREEPCCNFGRSDRDASAKYATYREQLPSEREQESSYGSYKPRIAVPIQGAEPSTGCEDLQGQIHQLSQSLRRVEMRVIDNENRIADLEAQLREARRVLKVI